ncbi:flotillin-1 isoform X1 [Zophobas morio]|uniref:flotillin-1 isoform X1 n=1 Tax=Zophobas morio TaxID=2755281 RepID=UPI00308347B6
MRIPKPSPSLEICVGKACVCAAAAFPTRLTLKMTWGFVTCGPNEALVISGCCYGKPLLIPGGRAFVWPAIQRIQRICLNTMTLIVDSPTVYTSQGVPISVTGIAQVKIQGQNEEMLLAACEQFLGKSQNEIQHIALVTLEGHQRAIMGSMTVEEIYKDRKKFSKQVFEVASSDLVNMGITVVSYTLKDIRDEEWIYMPKKQVVNEGNKSSPQRVVVKTMTIRKIRTGYLKSLGMARTAEVKRDARIGEAEARCDATIKEAIAEEQRMASVFLNDTDIAKAKRDFELKKAAYDVEVQTKNAEAEMAYELQAAKTKQRIKEEQMQIVVVERTQQIAVQEQEIQRRERELEATVRQPATAEKYRLEKLAEANHNRVILEAEAEAEAVRLRGEAEAFAIEAKAKAEAEQMAKKADAWREYKEAAMIDMFLEVLPKIAAEVAAPISQTKKITMVSTGTGEVGAAKLTGEVLEIVNKVPQLVKNLTGVDIAKNIHAV